MTGSEGFLEQTSFTPGQKQAAFREASSWMFGQGLARAKAKRQDPAPRILPPSSGDTGLGLMEYWRDMGSSWGAVSMGVLDHLAWADHIQVACGDQNTGTR